MNLDKVHYQDRQINDGPNTQGRKNTLQIAALNTKNIEKQAVESEAIENIFSPIKNVFEQVNVSDTQLQIKSINGFSENESPNAINSEDFRSENILVSNQKQ